METNVYVLFLVHRFRPTDILFQHNRNIALYLPVLCEKINNKVVVKAQVNINISVHKNIYGIKKKQI